MFGISNLSIDTKWMVKEDSWENNWMLPIAWSRVTFISKNPIFDLLQTQGECRWRCDVESDKMDVFGGGSLSYSRCEASGIVLLLKPVFWGDSPLASSDGRTFTQKSRVLVLTGIFVGRTNVDWQDTQWQTSWRIRQTHSSNFPLPESWGSAACPQDLMRVSSERSKAGISTSEYQHAVEAGAMPHSGSHWLPRAQYLFKFRQSDHRKRSQESTYQW